MELADVVQMQFW